MLNRLLGTAITHKVYFSCEIAHNGKSLISVFQEFSASTDTELSFCQGDWALGYHSMGFGQFPDIS